MIFIVCHKSLLSTNLIVIFSWVIIFSDSGMILFFIAIPSWNYILNLCKFMSLFSDDEGDLVDADVPFMGESTSIGWHSSCFPKEFHLKCRYLSYINKTFSRSVLELIVELYIWEKNLANVLKSMSQLLKLKLKRWQLTLQVLKPLIQYIIYFFYIILPLSQSPALGRCVRKCSKVIKLS